MTDIADTPLARAAKIIRDGRYRYIDADSLARAVLTAALKVRWEPCEGADGSVGAYAWLGPFYMAEVYPCRGKYYTSAKWQSDPVDTLADAKSAVERAVLEAILGETV